MTRTCLDLPLCQAGDACAGHCRTPANQERYFPDFPKSRLPPVAIERTFSKIRIDRNGNAMPRYPK